MNELKTIFEKISSTFPNNSYEFSSEIQELDDFFYKYCTRFIRNGYTQMYILREQEGKCVIGYFTLSSSTIQWDESLAMERIARYVPGVLLGMFAINKNYRRKGFGSDLIKKAVTMALKISEAIGCRCVFVDALIKPETINFYLNMGFMFVDKPLGKVITQKLNSKEKIDKTTIKMYFDLFKLKK